MLCEKCGKRTANYHYTSNINGKVTEKHLCAQCAAAEKGAQAVGSFADLLGNFFFGNALAQPERVTVCPDCGMTLAEVSRTGLMGCPGCYKAFSASLAPMLRRMHGDASHIGRIPANAAEEVRVRRRLAEAKEELSAAVAAEEYEKAAALRDEIRALQAKAEPPKAEASEANADAATD